MLMVNATIRYALRALSDLRSTRFGIVKPNAPAGGAAVRNRSFSVVSYHQEAVSAADRLGLVLRTLAFAC
jgi:hypothetical protein